MKACTLGRQCIRICAESFSKNIILRIQKPARLRGELYTLLHRNPSAKASFCVYRSWGVCERCCIRFCIGTPQQKHHFAYTEANASARGTVYASIQKLAAKSSFYVHIVSPLPGLPLHGLLCAGRLPSQTAACAVKEGILESLR